MAKPTIPDIKDKLAGLLELFRNHLPVNQYQAYLNEITQTNDPIAITELSKKITEDGEKARQGKENKV